MLITELVFYFDLPEQNFGQKFEAKVTSSSGGSGSGGGGSGRGKSGNGSDSKIAASTSLLWL